MNNFSDYISNRSAEEELDFVPYSARVETYLVPILFSIIFIVGIIGNWTVCIIFIKHPSMRNVPNTYVLKCDEKIVKKKKVKSCKKKLSLFSLITTLYVVFLDMEVS